MHFWDLSDAPFLQSAHRLSRKTGSTFHWRGPSGPHDALMARQSRLKRRVKKFGENPLQCEPFWGKSAASQRCLAHRGACGCSSGVEHNLAKVGVEGSNPFARSNFQKGRLRAAFLLFSLSLRCSCHPRRSVGPGRGSTHTCCAMGSLPLRCAPAGNDMGRVQDGSSPAKE
jgi:hypothetical protein